MKIRQAKALQEGSTVVLSWLKATKAILPSRINNYQLCYGQAGTIWDLHRITYEPDILQLSPHHSLLKANVIVECDWIRKK